MEYTHDYLVKKACKWLWGQRCVVVITEMVSAYSETPDAIGFFPYHSIVIECKASRQDFLRDKHKCHRRTGYSMGDKRFFLAPPGIIKRDELPPGHGLLELSGNGVKKVAWPLARKDKNLIGEVALLVSALRRIKGILPKGTSVRAYTYQTKNTATLGIKKTEEK